MNNTPEIKTEPKRRSMYLYADQLLCLLALLVMAVIRSGTRSAGMGITAVSVSVIVDVLCCRLTKKVYNPRDLSTVTSGLCLALLSPATLPYSLLTFGCALAIGVKHIFGGKNNYIFNPTAVSFAFLIICFPGRMLLFPAAGEFSHIFGDSVTTVNVGLENILLKRDAFPDLTVIDLLIGNFAGPVGTTHVLIIIVCALCLLMRRSVSAVVMVSCLSVIVIFRLLFPIYDDIIGALVREIFGGYLLFAMLFLANDPQTVPKTVFGKLYYGVVLGIFTIIFRGSAEGVFRGRVEGWFIFALLMTNTLSLRMDLAAEHVRAGTVRFAEAMRKRLTAYERFSERARRGETFTGDIHSTMELEINPSNYDMPPIDNKVIKIRRKKRNVLARVLESAGSLQENRKQRKAGQTADLQDKKKDTPWFFALAFKALFESVLKAVEFIIRRSGELDEAKPQAVASLNALPADEKDEDYESAGSSFISITDFEEIKEDVAFAEAQAEEEAKANEQSAISISNEQLTQPEPPASPEPESEPKPKPVSARKAAKDKERLEKAAAEAERAIIAARAAELIARYKKDDNK